MAQALAKAVLPLDKVTKRADYLRIAAANNKWITPYFVLQWAGSNQPEPHAMRLGITASRKVGNAVERNRAKRRLRMLGAATLPHLGRAGMDYVLIARKKCVQCSYDALIESLTHALRRIPS